MEALGNALESLECDCLETRSVATAHVSLPTKGSHPVASSPLLWDVNEEDLPKTGQVAPVLATWSVNGAALPASAAVRLLAELSSHYRQEAPPVLLGPDLRYWCLVGRFVLSLLSRQRFVPAAIEGAEGWQARWRPWLDDHADQKRFCKLVSGMPPACRAVQWPEATGSVIAARVAVAGFLESAIDACVRHWLAPVVTVHRQAARPEIRWRNALVGDNPALGTHNATNGSAATLRSLAAQIDEWLAQLMASPGASQQADGAFRLCFRLEAPEEPVTDPSAPAWTLRYLLQAAEDLSLLVPAAQIWQTRGSVLRFLDRRLDHPQERFLESLGRASRVFEPIEDSLRSVRPEAAGLSTEQAYTFLRETSLLLEEEGFGVLVPHWLGKRGSRAPRPGVRMRLAGAQGNGEPSAGLSMERIVRVNWELALGNQAIGWDELKRMAELKMPLVQVRGQWAVLDPDQVEAAIRFWERRQGDKEDLGLQEALRLALSPEGEHDGLPVIDVEIEGWLASLVDNLNQSTARGDPASFSQLAEPPGFNGKLRPYQRRGVSWLAFLRRWGFGACLADDMGLGKTAQAIGLLLHEQSGSGDAQHRVHAPDGAETPGAGSGSMMSPTPLGSGQPALVICPTSVVGNWQREVQRFAPGMRVMVHHGGDRMAGTDFLEAVAQVDVVISSYALMRRDIELLRSVSWSDVILDEAQNIKNPLARQTQAVRQLSSQFRLALTGTPVENRLSELWSIMHFLNPGYLGSQRRFRQEFARPIERAGDEDATRRLRSLTQPFVLRRVKTDPSIIQDLPEKLEMKVYCTLTPEQATLYQAVVDHALAQIEQKEGIERRGLVLSTLLKLKQVCNHPAQFLADGSPLVLSTVEGVEHRSGKLARLTEMLEEALAEGDRALIFTQYAEMGELLKRHLQGVFVREVLYLHGGTPLPKRDEMVTRFQSERGPALFVLSLKAGGTGLNLTAANHVFHYDRWWNPAVENQATDRAFRIGQQRNVQVHKLVTAGTLEEAIDELIERKTSLMEAVVGAGEGWLTELSTEELREVLVLRNDID